MVFAMALKGPFDHLENARLTGYTRDGYAACYHAHRPRPPAAIVDLILQVARTERARLVVDLGSGTGLSTVLWAPRAERVVGIEPLDEMRRIAEAENMAANVTFQARVAQATGLPDGAADVVTCAQSLHDMEPESALAEIARILRPGGVFAAYDHDWPPVVHPEAEQAFFEFMDRIGALRKQHGIRSTMQQWDKERHLARLEACGHFSYVRELALHHTEPCTAERWVGFALTIGFVPPVLDLGLDDDTVGLTALRSAAERTLGGRDLPWYVGYRVRMGVR